MFSSSIISVCVTAFVSNYLYGDPLAFTKRLVNSFSVLPLSAFYAKAQIRPISFLFGTMISFVLPSVVGTLLLAVLSLPHFIYCLLSWCIVLFTTDPDFERYGIGLAVFAVILGCDQYISFALRLIKSPLILLLIEIFALALAIQALESHAMPEQYAKYAMDVQPQQIASL
jgi:hypothetical protein